MKEYRLAKGVNAKYDSLEEFAAANNINVTKKTKDAEKLKSQQEKFLNRHKCSACGQPMSFVKGTNICACNNPDCKGRKITRADGSVIYKPVFDVLDDRGADIGNVIFE